MVLCDPGRAHMNAYGTLDLKARRDVVNPAEQMNATQTVEHLQAILDTYHDQPILLLGAKDLSPLPSGRYCHVSVQGGVTAV